MNAERLAFEKQSIKDLFKRKVDLCLDQPKSFVLSETRIVQDDEEGTIITYTIEVRKKIAVK